MFQKALFILLIAAFVSTPAWADEFYLESGSKVKGKVLAEDEHTVTISNAYGELTIKKPTIIKRNYDVIPVKTKPERWQVSFLTAGFATTGSMSDVLPWGFNVAFQSVYDLRFSKKRRWIPNPTAELDFLYAADGKSSVVAGSLSAGPIWTVPFAKKWQAFGSAVFGSGHYTAGNGSASSGAFKFTTTVFAGAKMDLAQFSLLPQLRFTIVHDEALPMNRFALGIAAAKMF